MPDTTPISFNQLKRIVHQRINLRLMTEMIEKVIDQDPVLWGTFKPDDSTQKQVYIALYKDL